MTTPGLSIIVDRTSVHGSWNKPVARHIFVGRGNGLCILGQGKDRAGGRTPRTARSGGGASRMLRGLMLCRRAVLGTPKCEKSVGRRGSAPDPAGGAYSAPQTP